MLSSVALLIEPLHKLNEGEPSFNSEKYPVLKTDKASPQEWWDSLNYGKKFRCCGHYSYSTKIEVGSIAMHYHQMSANYKWNCTCEKFAKLTKSQQRIITVVFSKRNDKYNKFDIAGLVGLR